VIKGVLPLAVGAHAGQPADQREPIVGGVALASFSVRCQRAPAFCVRGAHS
jgi:hypothetical protein